MTGNQRRVLILGGTAWLGRAIAERALRSGSAVTCAARGASGSVADGAEFVRIDRREPDAYDDLAARDWDDVIDVAWEPELVRGAVDRLGSRARHWTLVSSVSVYARTDEPGADETADRVPAGDASDYAAAKVASEDAAVGGVGEKLLVVRPGVISGPGDPSDRLGYWPARLAAAGDGPVLVPEQAHRWVQTIDVDDLAAFIVAAGTALTVGAINAVGSSYSFQDFVALAAEVADFRGVLVEHSDEELLAHEVAYFAGPRSLPFWLPAEDSGFVQRSNDRYLRAGGLVRSMYDTLRRTLDDERARGLDRERKAGLGRSDELAVLARLAA